MAKGRLEVEIITIVVRAEGDGVGPALAALGQVLPRLLAGMARGPPPKLVDTGRTIDALAVRELPPAKPKRARKPRAEKRSP